MLPQNGVKLRLRGKGIYSQREGRRGDHFVEVAVTLPQSLNERQRALLVEFEREEERKTGGGSGSSGSSASGSSTKRTSWF